MAQITSVSFGRTFNIGNYESVRFEVSVQVDASTDVHSAATVAREAVEAEFAAWRADNEAERQAASRPAIDPPASDKQRAFLDRIADDLGWPTERVAEFAASAFQTDLATLTKDQASRIIDQLMAIRDGKAAAPAATPEQPADDRREPAAATAPDGERATQRQISALERLQRDREIDDAPGRVFADLTQEEAGALIAAWQQRPRRARPARDEELPF